MAPIRGHEKQIHSLKVAIQSGRLPSALLFAGPSGVGKKQTAVFVAQHLLCDEARSACGKCGPCIRVLNHTSEGLLTIDPEETQIKLEHIQPIQEFLRLRVLGRARILIINQAHRMNPYASNALLKTLEEPPENTHFILVSSQESLLAPTVRSRLQTVRFGPLSETDLNVIHPSASWALGAAQGRMDLLTQFSDEATSALREKSAEILRCLLLDSRFNTFSQLAEISKSKEDLLFAFTFWKQLLRDSLVQRVGGAPLLHADKLELLSKWSESSAEDLHVAYAQIEQVEQATLQNADKMLQLENLWFSLNKIPEVNKGART
jgi:DNA polymerase-3 subunit delta'